MDRVHQEALLSVQEPAVAHGGAMGQELVPLTTQSRRNAHLPLPAGVERQVECNDHLRLLRGRVRLLSPFHLVQTDR